MREAIKSWLRRIIDMKKACPEIYWTIVYKNFIRGYIKAEETINVLTGCLCPITALVYKDTKKCPDGSEARSIVYLLGESFEEKFAGNAVIHAADNQFYQYTYNDVVLDVNELKEVRQYLEHILINGK